jgi:iron complex transport system substrate-binding protein
MRIVSLLPAATEIVAALGLTDDLVGISHGCDHPPAVAGRPILTRPAPATGVPPAPRSRRPATGSVAAAGWPLVDEALLASLRPDLVLVAGGPRTWDAGPATVVTLDPTSLEGIFHAIATVGAMTSAEDEAIGLVEILRERLADVEEVAAERRAGGHPAPRVVALEWLDPLETAGLWIPEQVRRAGGWDVLGVDGAPGGPTTWEAVEEVDPEMLLLAPRGLHLPETLRAWRATPRPPSWPELQAVRRGQVIALDGSAYFSRPGPRVIDGIELLAEIFDPDTFVDIAPARSWVPVP